MKKVKRRKCNNLFIYKDSLSLTPMVHNCTCNDVFPKTSKNLFSIQQCIIVNVFLRSCNFAQIVALKLIVYYAK
jgi:hypothetical protein